MGNLRDHGWDAGWEAAFHAAMAGATAGCVPARVTGEGHGLYRVMAESGEHLARLAGRLRHGAAARGELPAVGDWVAVELRPGEARATLLRVLPRRTALQRKRAGREAVPQVLAANLDVVFVVTALDRDLNLRRIERYLALAWEGGALPVVLLSKADLCPDAAAVRAEVAQRVTGVAVHALSVLDGSGTDAVREHLRPGASGAFLGSSGAGKSTLLNALLGSQRMAVGAVRAADGRGRHTTTARELIALPGGGVIVDTPGLREIQLWDAEGGLARAFEDLTALAARCRFRDCRHRGEPGCAVATAVAAGRLPAERLDSHRKLESELQALAARADPRARREAKQRAKALCKAQKRLYRSR
jgi:ribosome biogenesis GTPase